jgi:hypothetical protein
VKTALAESHQLARPNDAEQGRHDAGVHDGARFGFTFAIGYGMKSQRYCVEYWSVV